MGTSTDAYLYFGFEIYDPEFGIDDEDEKLILGKIDEEKIVGDDEDNESVRCYLENAAFDDIAKELGLDVNCHCSDDYPVYFVSAKRHWAWRGHQEEISSLHIEPTWINNLKEFCKRTGFAYKEPKWWLASYWG